MSSFHVSRRDSDEVLAEAATGAIVTIAAAGFLVLGTMFVSLFSETTRIWGEHAAPGQPARPTLLRGLKVFLGTWGLACLLALVGYAPWGAILGAVATVGFAGFVSIVGARADHLVVPPASGELDTYLTSFAEDEPEEEPEPPTASGLPVPLRVLRTIPPPQRASAKRPQVPR